MQLCHRSRAAAPAAGAHAVARRGRASLAVTALLAGLALDTAARAQPVTSPDAAPASELAQPAAAAATGRVIDVSGAPVAGARIAIEGGTATAVTDRDGRFHIAAPIGATLSIERAGYDLAIANVTTDTLDDVVLLVAGSNAETIEIRGEAPAAAPGAASVDRGELQRIPGTGGDFVRALTAMPGVVNLQVPLGYNGVVIRGSSPQDSKVMIDGFEVPLLFHNVGFRSVIPAEAIDSLDYIPGGFDVSMGRASSGVIALTTRPGAAERTTQAEVSLLDGGLLAQGMIGAHTRYMFGLRRSTIDLILPSLIPSDTDLSLTTVPRYYDGQLRIDHELSAHWQLMLSAIGSDDLLDLVASKDRDAAAKRFYNHARFVRATTAATYHDGPWTVKLALSGMIPQLQAIQGLYQRGEFTYPMVTPRLEIARTAPSFLGLSDAVWQSGAEAQVSRDDIDVQLGQDVREGEPPPAMDPRDTSSTFKGVVWTPDVAAWTSLAGNLGSRVRITAGLRSDVYGRSGEVVIEPRTEVQVKLVDSLTARITGGLYSRPPEYQTELIHSSLKDERSAQSIVGLTYEPVPGARIQTSAYYSDRSQLITRNTDGSLGNDGRGTTIGAELLATYRGGPWFTWLSYSYSHSTRVDHPGAAERLFDFDQPHSLNAAVSWHHGHWQLGGRFQLYSGLPFTPAIGSVLDSDKNVYMPVYGPINSERAPMHHQLDLRIDYSWQWGAAALTAFADVQNVYLDESTITYFYSYDYSQRTAFKSLPLLPSIGLRGVL